MEPLISSYKYSLSEKLKEVNSMRQDLFHDPYFVCDMNFVFDILETLLVWGILKVLVRLDKFVRPNSIYVD